MLDDGEYAVFVLDVDERCEGSLTISLTIVAGSHKGEVLEITAAGLDRAGIDLIGLPATLQVTDGQPKLALERL